MRLDDREQAVAAAQRARSRAASTKLALKAPRDRRGGLGGLRDSGGARGAARLPARFRRTPPGAVLDGRDIGTVICPDAEVKIFVTATPAGARPPPRRRAARPPARRSTKPTSSPTSCAATSATSQRARRAAEARAGCALARYHAFGYRRRVPGRRRHRRGRPSGPKARLTALPSWRTSPPDALRCAAHRI